MIDQAREGDVLVTILKKKKKRKEKVAMLEKKKLAVNLKTTSIIIMQFGFPLSSLLL